MSPIAEFMEIIANTAEENCMLDSGISLKELPAAGGIYAETGEGFSETTYFDKTEVKNVPVLFLCRCSEQKRAMEQLETICNYLQRLKTYPNGKKFKWLDTEIAKYPSKIGRDEDGVYHYSAILNCKLFF